MDRQRLPFIMEIERDNNGRISKKTEQVAGEEIRIYNYRYDQDKRLAGVDVGYGEAETYLYDSEGRRSEAQRNEPEFHVQRLYYQKDDHGADRLVGIDRSMVLHDDNGFRMYWEKQDGSHERYRYAPDYRLISVEKDGVFIEFEHDQNGQRVAKYVGGELAERYQWHDLVRLARAQVHGATMEFYYTNDRRVPFAMTRNDQDFRLYYDQVGSLRVVADAHGNVIKETLYDSFGLIQKETNPGFIIPIGFAGGLHDQDIGWVRFGYRDYDPLTGRFTAKDPIGYAGGDSDVYGYCLDDPVNFSDPFGLFRFGKKPLGGFPWLGPFSDNPIDDKFNTELSHEHGFYEDGSGENIGFGPKGKMENEDIKQYHLNNDTYDDETMRDAQQRVTPTWDSERYSAVGSLWNDKYNCQDGAENLRREYRRIWQDKTFKKGKEDYGK